MRKSWGKVGGPGPILNSVPLGACCCGELFKKNELYELQGGCYGYF